MRATSFALCNAATAFAGEQIDILPGVIHRSSKGLAIDGGAAWTPRLSATFPAVA
jgi:hypothetical protein